MRKIFIFCYQKTDFLNDFRCFGETLSTLQFAQRAKQVKNRAVVNEDVIAADLAALHSEIKRLKDLLKQNSSTRPYDENEESSTLNGESFLTVSNHFQPQNGFVLVSCRSADGDLLDAVRLIKKIDDDSEVNNFWTNLNGFLI